MTPVWVQFTTLVQGYITYGNGEFDGQDSGHDFFGVRHSTDPSPAEPDQ